MTVAQRQTPGQGTPQICLDTAEVTGSIPVAPTSGNPCTARVLARVCPGTIRQFSTLAISRPMRAVKRSYPDPSKVDGVGGVASWVRLVSWRVVNDMQATCRLPSEWPDDRTDDL
jgi:hypothetical protein